jgi:hypothetical protein
MVYDDLYFNANSNKNVIEVFGGGRVLISNGTAPYPTDTNKLRVQGSAIVDGNVGIGTAAPTYKLHVVGTAAGTSWTNLSSREYKDDVKYVDASEYDQMLARVVAMKPARYRYKSAYTDDPSVHLGFIAEEMPKDVLSPNGKGVDTYELVTYMAGAVKAQEARLEAQAQEMAELKALIRELQKRHK